MKNIKEILKDIQSNFSTKQRNEETITIFDGTIKGDSEFKDFIYKCHNGKLPNDFIFETISSCIDGLLDYNVEDERDFDDKQHEITENLISIYNFDLIEWYKQFSEYVEEARSEGLTSGESTIEQQMQSGQFMQIDGILRATWDFVKERHEEQENEE